VTILDTIVEQKRIEVARLPHRTVSIPELRAALDARGERRDFLGALLRPRLISTPTSKGRVSSVEGQRLVPSTLDTRPVRPGAFELGSDRASLPPDACRSVALIAEVKKASPSAGLIRPDFDPVRIACEYEAAGATCLSVLTDEKFFQGSLQHLRQIRSAVKLPLLRKDFIIDERQVLEAVEWGADAILLIVAILGRAELGRLLALAAGAGLASLVEVHDEPELDRALAEGAALIGVNNRNLKTFEVDLATTERLAARLVSSSPGAPGASRSTPGAPPSGGSTLKPSPAGPRSSRSAPLLVAESGIHTRGDVERLARCGARAILVGESLMRHPDIMAKVQELMGI
jgi:indole-3-glycerol phosphate synthase